jgi:hypothetical protein
MCRCYTQRVIGTIVALSIQTASLKVAVGDDWRYDPGAIAAVDELHLSPQGASAVIDGQPVLDIHNAAHPATKLSARHHNALSFNTLTHYAHMRERLGARLTPGCAGENILIETDQPLTLFDVARGIVIDTVDGGRVTLAPVSVARPCAPFSRWALDDSEPSGETLKSTLQFLDNGMRGFYCVLQGASVRIVTGARVYLAS